MAELEKNSNKYIRLHDKEFKIFISSSEISIIIENLAKKINNSKIHNPFFIVIINGAFLFAADLLRKVKLPNTEVSFLKLSSYSGTKTTGNVNELIGLSSCVKNRNIVIVEDIIDTGITLEKIINILNEKEVTSITTATLLFKPEAYQKKIDIEFIGKEIPNKFVVGYGLDYDELGRNLPHIYKLKD
jgi:hypoxanthine phosphoribosyltransferase